MCLAPRLGVTWDPRADGRFRVNLGVGDLVSKSRKKHIVRPRQIAIFLSRRYTDQPLQVIGRSFNRYHATALHAIGAVERELRQSVATRRQVEFLSNKLEAGKF